MRCYCKRSLHPIRGQSNAESTPARSALGSCTCCRVVCNHRPAEWPCQLRLHGHSTRGPGTERRALHHRGGGLGALRLIWMQAAGAAVRNGDGWTCSRSCGSGSGTSGTSSRPAGRSAGAAGRQGKGTVLAAKAVETQGTGSVVLEPAPSSAGSAGSFPSPERSRPGRSRRPPAPPETPDQVLRPGCIEARPTASKRLLGEGGFGRHQLRGRGLGQLGPWGVAGRALEP